MADMAKRPRAEKVTKTEIEEDIRAAGVEESAPVVKKKKKGKKQPTEGFSMRMPTKIFNRLHDAAEKTGLSKTSLVLQGLLKRLEEVE